jgi:short-subunit dehydrogenase
MTTQLSKGTALITGASSGIGAIYADRFAHRGFDLILVARDSARLEAHAARLQADTGRKVSILSADLTNKADLRRVEERLRSEPSISALVNNAGFGATKTLVDSDIDELERMIDLNVTALTRLTSAVIPSLIKRGNGIIINISSIVAVSPETLNGTYAATKSYVLTFSQSLHHELASKGIQVQAVLPGATSTDFWERAGVPVQHLPTEIVMPAEEMVDASLAGFDAGELVTIPSLPNAADWDAFDKARKALGPNLSHKSAAARYKGKVATTV